RVGEHPADAWHGDQEWHVAVLDTEPVQVALAVADLVVELVDQLQAGGDGAGPRFRQLEPFEQVAAGDAEEDRTRLAVGERDRVHALLEARAVTNEMKSEPRPL